MSKNFTCRECKYYTPTKETRGECFGHEVLANMPTELCPIQGFEPIRKTTLQSHMVFEKVGDIHTKTILKTEKKRDDWVFRG